MHPLKVSRSMVDRQEESLSGESFRLGRVVSFNRGKILPGVTQPVSPSYQSQQEGQQHLGPLHVGRVPFRE